MDFYERLNGATGLSRVLDALGWDEHGLVTVVSQDARGGAVLGVAHADRVAIEKSLETGLMHYYSRSRKKLWLKGEQSGHVQRLISMSFDCDGDAVLVKVRQVKANCHRGFRSCFSYRLTKNKSKNWIIKESAKRVFDPKKVYGK